MHPLGDIACHVVYFVLIGTKTTDWCGAKKTIVVIEHDFAQISLAGCICKVTGILRWWQLTAPGILQLLATAVRACDPGPLGFRWQPVADRLRIKAHDLAIEYFIKIG